MTFRSKSDNYYAEFLKLLRQNNDCFVLTLRKNMYQHFEQSENPAQALKEHLIRITLKNIELFYMQQLKKQDQKASLKEV